MSKKTMYYAATFLGSIVGGYIPALWGAGFLSISSLVFGTVGALLGWIIVNRYL